MKRPWKLKCCRCWKIGIPPTWLVIGAAILTQINSGFYPVIVRKFATAEKANPVVFSFYRDVGCCPVLLLCTLVAERRLMIPSPWMALLFLMLGLSGIFGGQVLYIVGVYLAGADIASAIQPLIPVWGAVLAYLTCVERLPSPSLLHSWTKFGAIGLVVGGAVEAALTSTTVLGGLHKAATHYLLGCACLVGNTVCTAIYILLQKKFIFNRPNCKWRDHPVAITAYSYFFGAVFMGLASLYVFPVGKSEEYKIPSPSAYALVYAIFINSAVNYLFVTWTVMHLSVTVVTAFWPVQVLVTIIASYFILGEKLARWQYIGAALVVVGLLLLLFSNHMEERQLEGRSVIYCCPQGPSHSCVGVYERQDERRPLIDAYKQTVQSYTEDNLSTEDHLKVQY